MRNANGTGSVYKLSGKRRRPYIARITVGWTDDGKQIFKTIGYYETQKYAKIALAQYNANPYDLNAREVTFGEIYKRWSEESFPKISESTAAGYRVAYSRCLKVFDKKKISDIRFVEYQNAINTVYENYGSRHNAKTVLALMYKYCEKYDIISPADNKITFIDIGKKEKSDLHYRFNDNEVAILWNNTDNIIAQIFLIMIYTGCRPGEIFDVAMKDIDVENRFIRIRQGKTENASRLVPIHEKIVPFVQAWKKRKSIYNTSICRMDKLPYQKALRELGILTYINEQGETKQHKMHDCRHTFASIWADLGLNEQYRRKIQGHAGSGIGEIVYTHQAFEKLRAEVNKIP